MASQSNVQHGSKVSARRIQPLDGWTVQTTYGTLKTHGNVELVRLEDVHTYLCGKGEPATDAVRKIFSPFYMACLSAVEDGNEDALKLPGRLHLLNALTWPNSLMIGVDRSKVQAVRVFTTGFPDLGHVRFADGSVGGLLYSIAEGAIRVWHGAADIGTDHLAAWKDRQDRELEQQYKIKWPKDVDLRKLLGRVAVPIETAFELWGWGSVSEVVQLRAVGGESEQPENWLQLVAFRNADTDAEWGAKSKGHLEKGIQSTEEHSRCKGSCEDTGKRIEHKCEPPQRAHSQFK